jgi:SHS2 domain-containing protein
MEEQISGYRELDHTADWEIEVWAPDLAGLFEEAARGMYALSGARLDTRNPESRTIVVSAMEPEVLLVMFLEELLYFGEMENLGFDKFELRLEGGELSAKLEGGSLVSLEKEIKAVTYHNLHIRETGRGIKVKIVFDV